MDKYMPPARTLLYGGPGAGKTSLAVSAFWDWKTQTQVADGRIITFGEEDNPALHIPEEARRLGNTLDLRLTSPLLDDALFLEQFNIVSRKLIYDAQQGKRLDVLVIDGFSEFDLLFEATYKSGGDNRFAKWEDLMTQLFSMLVRLSPRVLGCAVIATARVMERKKAQPQRVADPNWLDYDYYPSLRGSFRHAFPHYFNQVFYVEAGQVQDAGRIIPTHNVHMIRTGDFCVKNIWEHEWLRAGEPDYLTNVSWPELWQRLTASKKEA